MPFQSLFRPFSSPVSPPSEIKHTSISRTLSAGRCTGTIKSGVYEVPCLCEAGFFTLTPVSSLETVKCRLCDHLLSAHQDSHAESLPTEMLASAGNFIATQQRSMRCLRRDTVSKLADVVDAQDVVHVRGTPASGKTVLSELLKDYYVANNRNVFLLDTWTPLDTFPGHARWIQFAMVLQRRYPLSSDQDFFAPRTVILIDEAQASYKDDPFWSTIIKNRRDGHGPDIKICLFASYGSPLTAVGPTDFTPANFAPQQRITLTPQPGRSSPKLGLFFTRDEFNEVVSLLATNKYEERFTIDEKAMEYLYEVTNGHPGGVTSLIDLLHDRHRHDIKHGLISTITKDHVLDDLKDDSEVFVYLRTRSVARSFPAKPHLTREATETLGTILEEGNMQFDLDDVGMRKCYERGWVHRIFTEDDEDDIAVLPSRLHEKYLEYTIGKERRPLPERFDKLETLCLEILGQFSKTNLSNAVQGRKMSTAAKHRPMEAQYQDEFYRSFNFLAGRGVPIVSEWSRTRDGRVDFYIPEKKWAIELLRDHDRLPEHIRRFKPGGKYYSWFKDWIIIDCASSPRKSAEPKLWTAVFANDYSELKVYDYEEKVLLDVSLQK